jgi:hypothetical protein
VIGVIVAGILEDNFRRMSGSWWHEDVPEDVGDGWW